MDASQIKQAMEMVNKMKKIQKELEKTDITMESGKGEVKLIVTGAQEVKSIKLNPTWVSSAKIEDVEKELVKTLNKALKKSQDEQKEQMKPLTGGMNIPGLF